MLERRLIGAVGEDLLVRGRITQLALRSLLRIPRIADLAPYEEDRAPSPINEHTAVELLVGAAAVQGLFLVVERCAQLLPLSVAKRLILRENGTLHGVGRAIGPRHLG